MVFGQFVDSIPLLGSRRRVYVFIGAGLVAGGLTILAGAAGGWLAFAPLETMYVTASLMTTTGVVLQDVVADAMSTEVVRREEADGTPRPKEAVERELGLVQVLGRLALSFGIFSTAGIAGWLAQVTSYETVFLVGLAVPVISVSGALLVRLESTEKRPLDWRILGGGLAFGAAVTLVGVGQVPFAQELVFVVSMIIVIAMLTRVTAELDHQTRMKIFYAAVIIFVFRASPGTGEGYRWFTIDMLGIRRGVLRHPGPDRRRARHCRHVASERHDHAPPSRLRSVVADHHRHRAVGAQPGSGVRGARVDRADLRLRGARTIALLDTTVESPFAQLSMIPMLTLIAIHAPEGRRATWFALMASFMNLALVRQVSCRPSTSIRYSRSRAASMPHCRS